MPSNRTRAVPRGLQTLFRAGSLIGVTDGQLLARFALRDGEPSEAAFAALVERHGPLVWRTCRAALRDEHEAADAFQATFLVLVRKAGSLWVGDSIAPWLRRVALRAANQARREARHRQETERRAAELRAGRTEGEKTDDLADLLHREIDRLPERHRIVVILCDLEGRPYEEAARHLRCPVGTVKSRLARARERLRDALSRRGVVPVLFSRDLPAIPEGPPDALTASTIRGCVLFASDPIKAAGAVSQAAVILAEGVLRAMIRVKLQGAILVAVTALGLVVPIWVAFARQAAVDHLEAEARAASSNRVDPAADLEGNWLLRSYPGGSVDALIRIEGSPGRWHPKLLSIPKGHTDLARSKVDHLRIDERTIRFTFDLFIASRNELWSEEIIVERPRPGSRPQALPGSFIVTSRGASGFVYPVMLERTGRAELDKSDEATTPAWEDLKRFNRTKDPAEQREILDAMLEKYGDTPTAPFAAWSLAINRADAGVAEQEVRTLMDRTARIGARHGREMEIGAINVIDNNLVGAEEREGLVLEYARKAVALLHPDDPPALQVATLKILASALRKAHKVDESKALAEAEALEDRIAGLSRGAEIEPAAAQARTQAGRDRVRWARNFAAAVRQARAEGKLIVVDFYTERSRACERLDAEVFPRPEVVEAMRPFVPVKVDAVDGEGRPLVAKYLAPLATDYPAILFLDPAKQEAEDGGLVGRIPGPIPAGTFVEYLRTMARLPKDFDSLTRKAHPDDGDAMRQLATALAMRGRIKDAVALIDRAWGPKADPGFDRWAGVYVTLGGELMLRLRSREALDWFNRAAGVAKRPIDIYNAHLGAGFAALFQSRFDLAARELEAAARADGVSSAERDFARERLVNLARPPAGAAGVPEAAAALKRLEEGRSSKPGEQSR